MKKLNRQAIWALTNFFLTLVMWGIKGLGVLKNIHFLQLLNVVPLTGIVFICAITRNKKISKTSKSILLFFNIVLAATSALSVFFAAEMISVTTDFLAAYIVVSAGITLVFLGLAAYIVWQASNNEDKQDPDEKT
jgi:hypothetical protein